MHDFHLAKEIVDVARQEAQKNGIAKIKKIVIELGDIVEHAQAIKPDNLKYNINLLMSCQVEIKKMPGSNWKLVSIEGN